MDPRIRYAHKLFYRVPFLVPYWGEEEFAVIRHWWFGDHEQRYQRVTADLHVALRQNGYGHAVLTSTGRYALELALRSLKAPGGEVVIPSFVCRSVARAVLAAGCAPVFADINDDLTISVESISRNLSDRTVAVLVAHLSGKPATDFDAIIDLCRERRVALIDDAAQALGVVHRGRPLGTFGDFGILSFGVGKPTFSLGGGALVVPSSEVTAECDAIARREAEDPSSSAREAVRVASFLLQYRWRGKTLPLFAATRAARKLMRRRRRVTSRRGPIGALDAALQIAQLEKIEDILAGFRRNATRVLEVVQGAAHVSAPQASPDCGYTKLILRVSGGAVAMSTFLLKRGVEIEWSYRPLDLDPEFRSYARTPTVRAREIWPELLAVPVHPGLTPAQVEYVAASIAESSAVAPGHT